MKVTFPEQSLLGGRVDDVVIQAEIPGGAALAGVRCGKRLLSIFSHVAENGHRGKKNSGADETDGKQLEEQEQVRWTAAFCVARESGFHSMTRDGLVR